MKKKMYFLLLLAVVGLCVPAKAVLVNIPDANFRAKLQTLYPACFVGAQMETTCSGITSATTLNVSGTFSINGGITNLDGLQYFTSLVNFSCSYNALTSSASFPTLPSALQRFSVDGNQLISLPSLPTTLIFLDCSNNPLGSFLSNLTLPSGLQNLNAFSTQITSLPALPSGLKGLAFDNNLVTSFPNNTLPSGLTDLTFSRNKITLLPTLPTTLVSLWCDANELTNIPTLPTALGFIACENNFFDFADLEGLNRKPTTYSANPQSYEILPASQSLISGATFTISGAIGGTLNVYKWYKDNLLISGATSATYTKANATTADAGVYKCEVTSTYVGLGTTTGVTITSSNVTVCIDKLISNVSLPNGTIGANYSQTLSQTGFTGTLTWSVSVGTLPAGLSLASGTGIISGTPTVAGTSNFTVQVVSGGCVATKAYSIVIADPTTSIDNFLSNLVKISPNPSNGDFQVDFLGLSVAKSLVCVYDAQGKTVFSSNLNNNNNNNNFVNISLKNAPNGIYLLQINTEKGSILKRIVKAD